MIIIDWSLIYKMCTDKRAISNCNFLALNIMDKAFAFFIEDRIDRGCEHFAQTIFQ